MSFTSKASTPPTRAPPESSSTFFEDLGSGPTNLVNDELEMNRRNSTVQNLARKYTGESSVNFNNDRGFLIDNDPESALNPRTWAKAIAKLASDNGQNFRQTGVCFQNLGVYGYGSTTDFQKDVANIWLALPNMIRRVFMKTAGQRRIDILQSFEGVIRPGEMCVILGPPGSGCSTFLKTLSGDTNGIHVNKDSYFNYQGLSPQELHSAHKGDAIYTAEVDVHFPHLTVGETLEFASHARCQRNLPNGIDRDQYCTHYRDVVMACYGISHTIDTKVGDEYIRGVSGGERKRVTIAEATLAGAPLQCWDNSTRGLDSSNAIEFCKILRLQSDLFGQACAVSMYQAPQNAYDLFDKALVIYEGHQIYFGPASRAKDYFISLGYECPARQTTPDFLTSMTFPAERTPRPGCNPPRTSSEFAAAWKQSDEYKALQTDIEAYKKQHPIDGADAVAFRQLKSSHQAKGQHLNSPYTLTYAQQVRLCVWREYKRLTADPRETITVSVGNMVLSFIVSSLFYNLGKDTNSFYGRSVVLFVSILFNAFASMLEIFTLYAQRPIVEKHARYAFCHPSAEAYASVLVDLPTKMLNAVSFNLVFYFMTNLNREPGPFFFYLFVVFLIVLAMSGLFRSIASISRTEQQAMVPASVTMLALLIFTGFVVPIKYMLGWCRWINYLNPVAYGFETLMINEFHGRDFPCSTYIPDYPGLDISTATCDAVGAVAGQLSVSGDSHINSTYDYYHNHKWRNVGIIIAMIIFNHIVYFLASEYITAKKSRGEVLVFRRGFVLPSTIKGGNDEEKILSGPVAVVADKVQGPDTDRRLFRGSTSVFHWSDVCYDIKIKGKTRRLLDNVDGWVKPGTLTALMGVSGAGKTTLLDCLADRRGGVGIITGEMLVDGKIRDESFQRKTGYAQQQDLHLETSTVREALNFSALLRQPAEIPKAEKLAYVDEVITLLEMSEFADAVVGVLGEGLNIEQRKRLTIGVELAAKPPLLLFVDEPTSGLDSQTSWAIINLLEKLSRAGQSILCTVHQPSAMLFQRFDRLLLLAEGGRTVYFGDIGKNSHTITEYFERHGAPHCPHGANPAEWMLEAIGAAPGTTSTVDWPKVWRSSSEYTGIQEELLRLRKQDTAVPTTTQDNASDYREFAASFGQQFIIVTSRVFQQYWRTPSYIYSKLSLSITSTLFVGLVFLNAPLTIQGLQNQMFAIFETCAILGQLLGQQMPQFVAQRSLYEVRERPAKTYSWKIFMLSQIVAELPWNTLASVFMWALVYYPVGFYRNADAAGQSMERGGLMWLLFWQFMLFVSTFSHLCISFSNTAVDGTNAANFLFMLIFFFCGVLATPIAMPGFWIFLYRASPLSYWISAILSTGLANVEVACAQNEWTNIALPDGQTCGDYMSEYISRLGGYVMDPNATNTCNYCKIKETNVFLSGISSEYKDRWRNFGIIWVYIAFNMVASLGLYWLARMPKENKKKKL